MLEGGGGARNILSFPPKGATDMLILTLTIDFLCFRVFSNSNKNKNHEKGIKETNYIIYLTPALIYQHKKTVLKVKFQKLNSKLNIFCAVYWT